MTPIQVTANVREADQHASPCEAEVKAACYLLDRALGLIEQAEAEEALPRPVLRVGGMLESVSWGSAGPFGLAGQGPQGLQGQDRP